MIALIVTPEGFPLAYEVMPGNARDKTARADFLKTLEQPYGKANRTLVMERGMPTEETLKIMQESDPPIHYLVGTPKGRLNRWEPAFLRRPWEQAREAVKVKRLEEAGELDVLARSDGRVAKERAMRRRRLKRLWNRLKALQSQTLSRDELAMKVSAANKDAGRDFGRVGLQLPREGQPVTPGCGRITSRCRKSNRRSKNSRAT